MMIRSSLLGMVVADGI